MPDQHIKPAMPERASSFFRRQALTTALGVREFFSAGCEDPDGPRTGAFRR